MGMEKSNGDLIRSSTTPTTKQNTKNEKNKENKDRKSKSLTEKLRSKFSRRSNTSGAVKKNDTSDEITYGKIVVLGQAGVGKTAFIHRLVNNYFTEQYTPTSVSSSFDVTAIVECEDQPRSRREKILDYAVRKTKSFRTVSTKQQSQQQSNTKTFKFQVVDTTEDINDASPMMYRSTVANAHGFLLIVSSDKKDSIKYISEIYKDIAEMRINTIVPVIIIQNKDDLHTGSIEDEQFESELEQLAVSLEVETCQISTANSSGFETLTELLLNEMNVYQDEYESELAMTDDMLYSYNEEEPERKYLYNYLFCLVFLFFST